VFAIAGFRVTPKPNSSPVIGLPVRMDPSAACQYLDRRYADAVAAAGGIPVLLPLLENPGSIRTLAGRLHGVVLTGSNTDVDPAHYGAERDPRCGPCQPLRDETDFVLLSAARELRLPVLAICFGVQSLNVFLGGTLIQDIPSQSGTRHSQPHVRFAHSVEIASGSMLEQLAGCRTAMVNSTHHQALDRLGEGLDVVARAPDGIIESVAGAGAEQWLLGVQWHPEKSYHYDEFSRKIFDAFLTACRIH